MMKLNARRYCRLLTITILLLLGPVGCTNNFKEKVTLEVWVHAGRSPVSRILQQQVERFNVEQNEIEVRLSVLDEESYKAVVHRAFLAGKLPDVLDFDGPFLYNYAWQGQLVPLDDLLSPQVRRDLLPSIIKQGTYQGRLYSVGTFDSGVVIYGRRSQLEAAGVRIPQGNEDAWTAEEFDRALAALAENDPDGRVLDLKLNYEGEWFTFAFSPLVQSAGGDLIERTNYQSAEGVLNGPEAVAAMTRVQSWMQNGYVDPNTYDAAFVSGRVALSWGGHWVYGDYAEALGEDLVLLPLPDFGNGSKTGQGSWNWGITTNCERPEAAVRFLEYLLQTSEVLNMTNANGAIPATKSAIAKSKLYSEDGPMHIFSSQLIGGYSVPRPQTPAYPAITVGFQIAFYDIRNGKEVKVALDKAVSIIDLNIKQNQGYQ